MQILTGFCAAFILVAALLGCSTKGTIAISQTAVPPVSTQDAFGIMTPTDALDSIRDKTSSVLLLERTGSDYEAGLANLVTDVTPSLQFDSQWTDATSGSANLAYAMYQFNLQSYAGSKVLQLTWGEAPPDYTDLWIGLSHWDNNAWDFFPGTEDGTLDLDAIQPEQYIHWGTGDMLVSLIMLGTDTPILDSLQVGELPVTPISIIGVTPSPAVGTPGSELGFDVQFMGTNDGSTTFDWNFDGGAVADYTTVKTPTATLGTEGTYDCSVTVDNDHGDPDVHAFTLTVGTPISITGITPNPAEGIPGSDLEFDVQFTGTQDGSTTYDWDFAGGATPDTPTEKTPTVTLGTERTYNSSITVDNGYGDPDVYEFVLAVHLEPAGSWPMRGRNAQHTSLSPYNGAQTNNVKWSFPTVMSVWSSPTIAGDGTVYVGSDDFKLYAINPDGSEKWQYATEGNIVYSSPAIGDDGTIYIGSRDNKLHAVNTDGSVKWTFDTANWFDSSPVIGADGVIYIGCFDNNLYAVNPDGTEKWSYPTGAQIRSSPAIATDGTVYVGSDDSKLHAVNPEDGSVKWVYPTGALIQSSPAVGADGVIYIGSNDKKLHAVNPIDGNQEWVFNTGSPVVSSPAIDADGLIYVGSQDGWLYSINTDGTENWSNNLGVIQSSSPAIGLDGVVYVGSTNSSFYAINSDGTEKWAFETGNLVMSSPSIGSDGTVYVGSNDNNLYAFGVVE